MGVKLICPHPVGAILQLTNDSDPNALYPGTVWERIEDRFLVSAGGGFAAGSTGGSVEKVLSADNLPGHAHRLGEHTHTIGAHSHGLNSHTHSVGAHSHGLNSHTHTYNKPNSPTGSTAVSVAQLASHGHNRRGYWTVNLTQGLGTNRECLSRNLITGDSNDGFANAGSGNGHTHTVGTTSTNTGGNSGSTANSAAFNSGGNTGNTENSAVFNTGGGSGSTSSTGEGRGFAALPVYKVVNVWERTA